MCVFLNESVKILFDLFVSLEDVFRECFDKIDSGFESVCINLIIKFSKVVGGIFNFNWGRILCNVDKLLGVKNEVLWEVFFIGRKFIVVVYSCIFLDEKFVERELCFKLNLLGRGKIV